MTKPLKRYPHLCLACGCYIDFGLPEERVESTRGRTKGTHRFRHVSDEDCQAALRRPQPNVARIGNYRQ